jgi:hypothetical protein
LSIYSIIPKICFRERTKCSPRGEKIQTFSGEEYPRPPTITYDNTPNVLSPTDHLSSLHTQYSMVPFCRCPSPHGLILKSPVRSWRFQRIGVMCEQRKLRNAPRLGSPTHRLDSPTHRLPRASTLKTASLSDMFSSSDMLKPLQYTLGTRLYSFFDFLSFTSDHGFHVLIPTCCRIHVLASSADGRICFCIK